VFQKTVGRLAFKSFARRRRMSHDLAQAIPGAPAHGKENPATAVQRLRQAVQQFQKWDQPLQPHFAFGELSKAEYEQAHAMHIANHFSAFDAG
jgi:hypothetical protein